jgi:hypothetical protein
MSPRGPPATVFGWIRAEASAKELMMIWKLTPTKLGDPNWEASSHRGAAVVRAATETAARRTAAKAFDVKTRFQPNRGVRFPPWGSPRLVRAEPVEDERYAPRGPTEVLEPSF